MSPGDHLPVDKEEDQSNPTSGGVPLKSPQEIPSSRDPISRGNTIPNEFISSQPLPASQEAAGQMKPTCPRCGLAVSDPPPPSRGQAQGSISSADSRGSNKRKKSRSSVADSHQPAATASDAWFHLLLACLSCQCSVLLLGLLEACSSCLHALCSSCCHACARCCSAVQEAPVEEFNCHAHCHSVLFESCCEPTECLEFCLECCELCHRS